MESYGIYIYICQVECGIEGQIKWQINMSEYVRDEMSECLPVLT